MLKYNQYPNSIYEIIIPELDTKTQDVINSSLEYFNNWPSGRLPDINLPFDNESVLPPKNYFILTKKNHEIDLETLQKLDNYVLTFPLLIESVLLLSKDWIKLDEHKIVKTEGQINYIFIKNKLYKVFDNKTSITELIELNNIGPNTWFWRI